MVRSLWQYDNFHTFLMEQRIVINPEICGGCPVIAGTRITAQRPKG
jgi:uncharacterized protein (DUF433 family)